MMAPLAVALQLSAFGCRPSANSTNTGNFLLFFLDAFCLWPSAFGIPHGAFGTAVGGFAATANEKP